MHTIKTFTWEFGGPLAGMSLPLAVALLLLAFAGGAGVVWWSYQNTLHQLSAPRKRMLITLRLLVLMTLLICLANPTQVDLTTLAEKESPTAVLLIDHSASMTTEDNRGQTRLDDAVRTWRPFADRVRDHYGEMKTYHFDADLRSASDKEIYPDHAPGPANTQLLGALLSILDKENPDAVFVITDGLDTNDQDRSERLASLSRGSVPLSFIVGENRITNERELSLREFNAPAEVLREASFPVQWVVEARLRENKQLPVTLRVDDQPVMTQELSLVAGYNLLPLSTKVVSGQPGERMLALTIGEGRESRTFRRMVSVVNQRFTRVLYYQGTPDWGFRFTKNIFAREPSIELTSIFKPTDTVTVTSGQEDLEELPDQSQALSGFDVVLLSQVPSRQLTPARQEALKEYVRQGGGLLVILPDAQQAKMLKQTSLETILPVFLEDPNPQADDRDSLRQQMRQLRHSGSGDAIQLHPFSILEDSPYAYIFDDEEKKGQVTPQFATAAPVYRLKAGAHVLAYHPTEKDETGRRGILLAIQRFGAGHTAVLATDSLWRWKLSEPSDSHAPEQFWQQLLHSIAGPANNSLHLVRPPVEVSIGTPVILKLACGPGPGETLDVVATNPEQQDFTLDVFASDRPDHYEIHWTPQTPGEWTISARTADANSRQIITVSPPRNPQPDRAHENVDYDLLRHLASATGGEMLEPGTNPRWIGERDEEPDIVSERRLPLWSIWPIFLFAAALYASELILRRRWKLL